MRLSRATICALIAVLIVGLAASGLATGAGNRVKVKTKVTMKLQGSDYGDTVPREGRMPSRRRSRARPTRSSRRSARRSARSSVFRKVLGGKERVGGDKTNKKGEWSVNVGGLAAPGKHFAQAKKKKVKVGSKKGVCKKGKSKSVAVS